MADAPGAASDVSAATVDLVLATVDRTSELARFLESLRGQSFRDVRLIVVDQNDDDRLDRVLEPHAGALSIVRLRSEAGLSRARNVALPYLQGQIVGFPDDDCWYPAGLLRGVVDWFAEHPAVQGLSGRSLGSDGKPSNMRWDDGAGPIDRMNLWRRAISYTVFFRREVIEATGDFAPELGAGSGTPWGSGEEADYLLRALAGGFSVYFDPALIIGHENPRVERTRSAARRAYRGGLGHGRLLRLYGYPLWFAAWRVVYLLGGASLLLARARPAEARFYLAMAIGRARGWLRPT